MQTSDRKASNQTDLLFSLRSFCIYFNDQIIVQRFYNIIIYTIYWS